MRDAKTRPNRSIALVTFLVREYDDAIAFFTEALGFALLEDSPQSDGKRWVVVGPEGDRGATLLLARASTPEQRAQIGNPAGGRVAFFLETDDFPSDHRRMQAVGVRFAEAPRHEPYGTVAVFVDLYGNKWDLLERSIAP